MASTCLMKKVIRVVANYLHEEDTPEGELDIPHEEGMPEEKLEVQTNLIRF